MAARTGCMQLPWGSAEKETKQAFNTCPLAMGQAGQAASIQQHAGSSARVPSHPRDSSGLSKAFWKGRAWARRKDASLAALPRVPQCKEFGGGKVRGGFSSCAMLFLYKAIQGDVSLDTVGMKSRKFLGSQLQGVLVFFPFSFSFLCCHCFTHKAGGGCPTTLGCIMQHPCTSRQISPLASPPSATRPSCLVRLFLATEPSFKLSLK